MYKLDETRFKRKGETEFKLFGAKEEIHGKEIERN